MRYKKLVFFAFALSSQHCLPSGDHLVPEHSVYAAPFDFGFDRLLMELFKQVYLANARVIVVPAFGPEYALGVTRHSNGYALLGRYAEKSVWGVYSPLQLSETMKDYEALAATIPVRDCGVQLEDDLGSELVSMWEQAVRDTRHPDEYEAGFDGVTYHFASQPLTPPIMVGQTWSPPAESKMGKLVAIVGTLSMYCQIETPENLEKITTAVERFRDAG